MPEVQPSYLAPPYLQFVETMAQALDARDPYTAGHSIRVSQYSHSIALALGLSEHHAGTIRVAAQLHDIGKIGMSDAVLQKPSRLTPEEFAAMKMHPQIGRRILEGVDGFGKYLSVTELHHENVDGSGYPYGLRGEEIPLEARIVRIADAFDAMTSHRSYRPRLSHESACKEIFDGSGRHFDRQVACVFLKLVQEGQFPPMVHPLLVPRAESQDLHALNQTFHELETR